MPSSLEKIQAAEQKGQQEIVIRQLTRRVGNVSHEVESQVKALRLDQLDELLDAALTFTKVEDLMNWFDAH